MGSLQSRNGAAGQRDEVGNDRKSDLLRTRRRGSPISMSSNRRLRLRIPKRQSGRKTDCVSANHTKVDDVSTPTPSPIVAAFMTNISGRNNCGLSDCGSLVNGLSTRPRAAANWTRNGPSSDQKTANCVDWSSAKKRQVSQRMAAILDIPSPVPSVSEPSEDNVSAEDEALARTEENELEGNNDNPNDAVAVMVSDDVFISGCCAKSLSSKNKGDTYVACGEINHHPETNKPVTIQLSPDQGQCDNIPNGNAFPIATNKSHSLVRWDVPALSNTAGNAVAKNPVPRPNSFWPKLPQMRPGRAPLAESECFVIENSPAIETPPYARLAPIDNGVQKREPPELETVAVRGIIRKTDGSRGCYERDQANEQQIGDYRLRSDWVSTRCSRIQSRLKNPSAYATCQNAIYNRVEVKFGDGQKRMDTYRAKESECVDPACSISEAASAGDLSNENRNRENFAIIVKHELHDSGIKMDSFDGIGDGIGASGHSKAHGSPEGSIYRGLIDDEIRDQPDLTIGCISPELPVDSRGASSLKEDAIIGPLRPRERRSTNSVMNNSYSGTVSSLSIDSTDMMLDFDESVEESDAVWTADVSSTLSSLGRRRSRNSASGCPTGSGGRRRGNLGAIGKRASLEAVIDEWNSLKGRTKNAVVDDKPNDSLPDDQHSTTTSSGSGRVLKPPVSLDCVGSASIGLEQQTYRHMVQDVTVVKTLLLRLKRVLQESETSNPFEHSITPVEHGAGTASTKLNSKVDGSTVDVLKEENYVLKKQMALMSRKLEDQNRVIECLQHQVKQYRQRTLRRSQSVLEEGPQRDTHSGYHALASPVW